MNYRLPILSGVFVCFAAIPFVAAQKSQVVYEKEVASLDLGAGVVLQGGVDRDASAGQKLIAQAAQRLLLAPGIEAKTRQRVNIFDQQLVGSGTYLQLAQGSKLLLKLDLKLQVGNESSSLRQISNGDFLWVLRRLAGQDSVSRVNVRRLREAAANAEPVVVPPSLWMALGGIPRLLSQLDGNFEFGPPKPLIVGKLPVWSIEGRWKNAVLANLLPEQKDAILSGAPPNVESLPVHVPHGVTVVLGRDQIIPLFPYSFSFYREIAVDGQEGSLRRIPMVTWELFEVRVRPDLQASEFEFRPTDQEVKERTSEYIARLQAAAQASKPRKPPPAEPSDR